MNKFQCLIAFASRQIGQCVLQFFLTSLWRLNFEINLIFLIKPFVDMTENLKQKFK